MSNSTPTHSPKLISEMKKKKKKKSPNREENQEIGLVVHAERERDQKGQRTEGTTSTSKLADQLDLTPARARGQQQRQREGGLRRT